MEPLNDGVGVEPPREDWVASGLEIAGWFAFFVSAAVLAFALYLATKADATESVGAIAGFGAVGIVQSLLLVGFGRIVHNTHEAAEYQRQTAVLLAIALDERD